MSFEHAIDRGWTGGFFYHPPRIHRDTDQNTVMMVHREVCTGKWEDLEDKIVFTNKFGILIDIKKKDGKFPPYSNERGYENEGYPRFVKYYPEADRIRRFFKLRPVNEDLFERIGRSKLDALSFFPVAAMYLIRTADVLNASRPRDNNPLAKYLEELTEKVYWNAKNFCGMFNPLA